jgi:hypothetical protein
MMTSTTAVRAFRVAVGVDCVDLALEVHVPLSSGRGFEFVVDAAHPFDVGMVLSGVLPHRVDVGRKCRRSILERGCAGGQSSNCPAHLEDDGVGCRMPRAAASDTKAA